MKDYRAVEDMLADFVEEVHDSADLKLTKAYNLGYEAGFNAKNRVENGCCTDCAYEFLPHYKEPCKDCRNSHQNLYKAKR